MHDPTTTRNTRRSSDLEGLPAEVRAVVTAARDSFPGSPLLDVLHAPMPPLAGARRAPRVVAARLNEQRAVVWLDAGTYTSAQADELAAVLVGTG